MECTTAPETKKLLKSIYIFGQGRYVTQVTISRNNYPSWEASCDDIFIPTVCAQKKSLAFSMNDVHYSQSDVE